MASPVGLQAEKERNFLVTLSIYYCRRKNWIMKNLKLFFILVVTMSLKMIKVLAMSK